MATQNLKKITKIYIKYNTLMLYSVANMYCKPKIKLKIKKQNRIKNTGILRNLYYVTLVK